VKFVTVEAYLHIFVMNVIKVILIIILTCVNEDSDPDASRGSKILETSMHFYHITRRHVQSSFVI
jgi:hypothetical protein